MHMYSHFHVITDLPMNLAPGHMHTLMEHIANDNEFDPVQLIEQVAHSRIKKILIYIYLR